MPLDRVKRAARWKLHEAELALLRRAHPLRYLFLEITRRCNLACSYCGSSCHGGEQRPELTTPEWIAIVRQLAADFPPREMMVAVMGGEPLLKDGVFDLFAELQTLGFPYGMVTNGQLLDAETARRLVAHGIGSISVSIDAPPDLNDTLRGRGSTAKAVEAIRNLQSAGFSGTLEVLSTITAPAVARLGEMRAFVAGLRVAHWRVAPVMPIGRAAERPDLVPSPAQLRAILDYVLEARRDPRNPVPELCEEGFLGVEYEGKVRKLLWNCLAGITTGGIRADGRIGACPELADDFLQGDVRTERFRDVWEQRYQVFRDRSWTRRGRCATCGEFGRCQGGSLHLYPAPGGDPLRCLYLDAVRSRPGDGERP